MDSIPSQLLLQVILIFLNAFFAATEIAVLSVNKTQLKKKAEKGEKTAKRLLLLLQEPAGFLSTIQIGITLAGFLASAFAADNFSDLIVDWLYQDMNITMIPLHVLDTISVILITIILSYFTLILGIITQQTMTAAKNKTKKTYLAFTTKLENFSKPFLLSIVDTLLRKIFFFKPKH